MPVRRGKDGNIVEVPTHKVSGNEDGKTFRVKSPPGADIRSGKSDTAKVSASSEPDSKTRLYRGGVSAPNPSVPELAGWLVITEGPGRGQHFPIGYGVSSIGRGASNRIQMDIGDDQISKENQCFVTFDPDDGAFYVAGGTGINITKHNGRPLSAANIDLADRDRLKFGDTEIQFIAFCSSEFRW